MAVELILGLPGAGKTYHAVSKVILPQIQKLDTLKYPTGSSRRILTNIDGLKENSFYWSLLSGVSLSEVERGLIYFKPTYDIWDYDIKKKFNSEKETWEFHDLQQGDFIVLDEAQLLLPSTAGKTDPDRLERFRQYLTHHRKFGHDWLIITQHESFIHSVLKSLIDQTYYLSKRKFIGSKNTYNINIHRGASTLKRDRVSHRVGKYLPDNFRLFQSYKVGGVDEQVNVTNVFMTPKFLIFAGLFFAFILGGSIMLYRAGGFFPSSIQPKKEALKAQNQTSKDGNSAVAVSDSLEVKIYDYRIVRDICQAETSKGLQVLPAAVCVVSPYVWNGKTYKFQQRVTSGNASGHLL